MATLRILSFLVVSVYLIDCGVSAYTCSYPAINGNWYGESRECVALIKAKCGAPQTSAWRRGAAIGPNTPAGTAIATFCNSDGSYRGHAAIFIRNVAGGIEVYDQWNTQSAWTRVIRAKNDGCNSNNANAFYVIN